MTSTPNPSTPAADETPVRYRYYISYTGMNYAGQVFGWSDLTLGLPIRSGDDIQRITDYIKTNNDLQSVTILGFQRFDTPAGAA